MNIEKHCNLCPITTPLIYQLKWPLSKVWPLTFLLLYVLIKWRRKNVIGRLQNIRIKSISRDFLNRHFFDSPFIILFILSILKANIHLMNIIQILLVHRINIITYLYRLICFGFVNFHSTKKGIHTHCTWISYQNILSQPYNRCKKVIGLSHSWNSRTASAGPG